MLTHGADSIAMGNGHRLGTELALASGIWGFWSAQLECLEHASQVRVWIRLVDRIASHRIALDCMG